ncbi:hypothetical protein [Micromonospora aurantiaca (nom. illeg.)]|uniref:hypothetical protein n=1 Tax=Micromonospora aurantiaca (nom. illeg.) TaxID=47850 RepID=UPI0033D67293
MDQEQAARAVRDIADRHAKVDDPHLERLGDEPLDVLRYLRKYSNGVPDPVSKADVADGLRLRIWLWWETASLELWLLDRAERLGVNRREIGALLGIRTGQGLVDRRDRLRALLGVHGRPDEKAIRVERAERRANLAVQERQQRWLIRHQREIFEAARVLVRHQNLADEEAAEWLVEVARDLQEASISPAAFTVIDLAVDAMATVDEVAALPDEHPLRQVMRQWQSIAARYRSQSSSRRAAD